MWFNQLFSALIVYILFSIFLVLIVHFFLSRREEKKNLSKIAKYEREGDKPKFQFNENLYYAIPLSRKKVLRVSGREFLTFAALLKCCREKLKNPLCTDDEAWLHYVTFVVSNYFKYLIFVSRERSSSAAVVPNDDANPSLEYLSQSLSQMPSNEILLNRLGRVVTDDVIFREYIKLLFRNRNIDHKSNGMSLFKKKHPSIPIRFKDIDLGKKVK
nr:MAG: hypothetical protein [Porcellio scaber clopovirus]